MWSRFLTHFNRDFGSCLGIKKGLLILLFVGCYGEHFSQDSLDAYKSAFYALSDQAKKHLYNDLDSMGMVVNQIKDLTKNHPQSLEYAVGLVIEGEYFNKIGVYDSAMTRFEAATVAYENVGEVQGAARCQIRIAQTLEWQGKTEESLVQHQKSLEGLVNINDSHALAVQYETIAGIYAKLGQYSEAIGNFLKAKTLHEETGNLSYAATAHMSIGLAHRQLGNTEKELEALEKAYSMIQEEGDSLSLGLVSCNLGETYVYNDRGEEGLKLLKDSERLFTHMKQWNNLISTYHAYVRYYDENVDGQREIAIDYAQKSKELAQKINQTFGQAAAGRLLGMLYNKDGRLSEAIAELRQAILISEEHEYLNLSKRIADILATVYEKKGDYKNGLLYHKKFTTLKDSMLNKDKIEELKEIELGHEFAQKRLSDSLQTIQKNQRNSFGPSAGFGLRTTRQKHLVFCGGFDRIWGRFSFHWIYQKTKTS